jgi:type II secretory ATPase GspE/PulE/Tfp pilus assembly ATPase PilB-like protein
MTGSLIKPVLVAHSQLSQHIQKYYFSRDSVHEILKDTMDDTQVEQISEERMTSEEITDAAISQNDNSSFIKLVNRLLCDAVDARASDIHIEPRDI